MRAFILRRVGFIQEGGAGSVLVGRPGAPDLVRLQGFLARNGYPYTVLDASADGEGRAVVERFGVQPDELPLMLCPNGTVLKRPTDAEAAVCLGITPELDPESVYDVAVVGRGARRSRDRGLRRLRGPLGARARPARLRRPGRGLGADRELSRLSHRHLGPGAGRARLQPGAEIRRRDRDPAGGGAARLRRPERRPGDPLRLELTDGRAVRARTVVVASGARYRRPDIPNLATSRAPASPTGPRRSRRSCARARRWRWSAAATRRARPPCSSRPRSSACIWSCAGKGSRRRCRATSSTASARSRTSTCTSARRWWRWRATGPRALLLRRSATAPAVPRMSARCAICSCSSAPIPTPPG